MNIGTIITLVSLFAFAAAQVVLATEGGKPGIELREKN